MDRRDALKSLAAIPGLTVTPVTVKEADEAVLLVLKCQAPIKHSAAVYIKAHFEDVLKGTRLEGVKVVVLDGDIDLEIVRKRIPADG